MFFQQDHYNSLSVNGVFLYFIEYPVYLLLTRTAELNVELYRMIYVQWFY
jgi:hypothetical protein